MDWAYACLLGQRRLPGGGRRRGVAGLGWGAAWLPGCLAAHGPTARIFTTLARHVLVRRLRGLFEIVVGQIIAKSPRKVGCVGKRRPPVSGTCLPLLRSNDRTASFLTTRGFQTLVFGGTNADKRTADIEVNMSATQNMMCSTLIILPL